MKSHINEARFTKRIPTEQFAYEEYSLSAAIDPSESGEDVLIEMRKQVSSAFAADLVESTEAKKETKAAKKAATKEEKKNAKSGKSKTRTTDDEDEIGESADEDTGSDDEGVEDDEAADDQVDDDGDDSSDNSEDDEEGSDDADGEDEEDSKPAKGKSGKDTKAPAKETKGKKVFKRKPQVYDRQIDQHREIFSRELRSLKPNWKESDVLKAKAKKASEELEGEDFLDENGEVLASFKATLKALFLGKTK